MKTTSATTPLGGEFGTITFCFPHIRDRAYDVIYQRELGANVLLVQYQFD